jgi:hypothetical protein
MFSQSSMSILRNIFWKCFEPCYAMLMASGRVTRANWCRQKGKTASSKSSACEGAATVGIQWDEASKMLWGIVVIQYRYTYTHIRIHIDIHIDIHVHINININMYIYIYTYIYIHKFITYIHIHICICIPVCHSIKIPSILIDWSIDHWGYSHQPKMMTIGDIIYTYLYNVCWLQRSQNETKHHLEIWSCVYIYIMYVSMYLLKYKINIGFIELHTR